MSALLLLLGKLLNKEVRVLGIQHKTLLTKPHWLFFCALPWTTWLFLIQTPLILFPGYTPTCSYWACGFSWNAQSPQSSSPSSQSNKIYVDKFLPQGTTVSLSALKVARDWFSATAFCCAQLIRRRNPTF